MYWAISTVLTCGSLISLSQHPLIHRFLWGATNLYPPVVHRYPTWDLSIVLNALTGAPYGLLQMANLQLLSCKAAFLVAITFQGESRRLPHCLHAVTSACSTRIAWFCAWTLPFSLRSIYLFTICRNASFLTSAFAWHTAPPEQQWHTLDVRRALRVYQWTSSW